jgi:hypothetical protein
MSDPTIQPAPDDREGGREEDRGRTIDSLLDAGLDRYFAGEYERAIHAWTRVLFLDRTHARARAYIERARSILAERQRETDELLHRGLAALDAGDTEGARSLLAAAVQRGGAVEAAELALHRLGRLSVAPAEGLTAAPAPPARTLRPAARTSRPWTSALLAAAGLPLLLLALGFAFRWDAVSRWMSDAPRGASAALRRLPDPPLPQPSLEALALQRARALFARGHLHQALRELDAIGVADPRRSEADRLRAEVQRALLAAAGVPGAGPAPAGGATP